MDDMVRKFVVEARITEDLNYREYKWERVK